MQPGGRVRTAGLLLSVVTSEPGQSELPAALHAALHPQGAAAGAHLRLVGPDGRSTDMSWRREGTKEEIHELFVDTQEKSSGMHPSLV